MEEKKIFNFCGLDEEYSSFKRAKAVIIPVPYDKTATYMKGTRNGPAALLDASRYLERYDDELNQETFKIGIHTMDPLPVEELDPDKMCEKVYQATLEVLKSGKFPVVVGGEHSISPGAVKAFQEVYSDLSVLHLDAHYDLRDELNGSKFNHGCAARRMSEICPIVQVGVRSMSKEDKEFLSSQTNGRIKSFSVYDILEKPLWKDEATNKLTEHVYISIDLDVFDPALVPGTGTPEPGGLGWYEILDLFHEVVKDKKVVGFDIMELMPLPGLVASDFLAAKLLYRLLGYAFPAKK